VDLEVRRFWDEFEGPFARYRGTIEVPAMTETYTDRPLDLGILTLDVYGVGDLAPLFEAKAVDGKLIRLIDYRGKFVLLRFWTADPDFQWFSALDRYQELHETYGRKGVLQIIGVNQVESLNTVKKYVAEHKIEWPEIQSEASWEEGIFGQYHVPYVFYNVLVDPDGKVVATNLHKERLTNTVHDALERVRGMPSESGKR
jgi:peroxiredoxin